MKKTILIGFAALIFFVPTPAHALFNFGGCAAAGAGGAAAGAVSHLNAVPTNDSVVRANTTAVSTKECVLDGLASVLTQSLITSITYSTINWINSGFEGGPAFITNYSFFLQNIADQTAVQFIQGSELGLLCSPFENPVRLALIRDYQRQNSFAQRISCSLDNNIAGGFLKGDFSQGGWQSLFRIATEPQNNYIYTYVESRDTLNSRIVSAQNERLLETSEGGFFSKGRCVLYGNAGVTYTDEGIEQITVTPKTHTREGCAAQGGTWEIVTNGEQIEEQVDLVLGSGLRQLELADEIDEVINALMAQLSQQTFTSLDGLRGLSSNTSSSAFNGQSYIGRLSSEVDTTTLTQARTVLIDDINIAVQFEEGYQDVLGQIITRYGDAQSNPDDVPAGCNLSSVDILNDYKNLRTASIERVSTLLTLRSSAQSAGGATELNAVADEYELLLESGTLQTGSDIAFLAQELDAIDTCQI